MRRSILTTIVFILFAAIASGQDTLRVLTDTTDLSNMSLEELSRMKSRYAATDMEKIIAQAIEAASRKPQSIRKSASIISMITADEIERSGAKDFMDVLAMIPGLEFNVDVEGVVALSFRGMWSNEGNISLQIDGQELNEIAYASLQFGNHYQLSQIKKVEIIRGPGSAIYGGCAEYAVINIVTKKGEDINGIEANAIYSHANGTYGQQTLAVQAGARVKDFSYAAYGALSKAMRSNTDYTDVYGSSYNMTGNSGMNNGYASISLGYKNLSFEFIYDNYTTLNRDASIGILSRPYSLDFLTTMAQLKYTKQLTKKLQLAARLNHRFSEPWSFTGQPDPVDSEYSSYLLKTNTYKSNISALWDARKWLNVNAGIEAYMDRGRLAIGGLFRTDSTDFVSYMNYAPFAQLLFKTQFANITLGARYDISTAFGSAFNPRLGITKKVGITNFKLLYASSFRAPAIESTEYGIDNMRLKPERSHTIEFEASVKMRKDMYLSLNIFDITTYNAIRYFVKTDSVFTGYPDGYRNSDIVTGSQGLELEYKYKSGFGFINFSYSFYTIQNKNVDDANAVPGHRSVTLGTAPNKLALQASFNIGRKFYISPTVNFLDRRWAYASTDSLGNGIITQYKTQWLVNIYAGTTAIKNCSAGIGIHNITDERIIYPQAYNSLHAPLPGMGRELYLQVSYKIPFKKNIPDR